MIDADLRKELVCPECRGELVDGPDNLICERCALVYPIVDGAPWLLRELALATSRPADASSR